MLEASPRTTVPGAGGDDAGEEAAGGADDVSEAPSDGADEPHALAVSRSATRQIHTRFTVGDCRTVRRIAGSSHATCRRRFSSTSDIRRSLTRKPTARVVAAWMASKRKGRRFRRPLPTHLGVSIDDSRWCLPCMHLPAATNLSGGFRNRKPGSLMSLLLAPRRECATTVRTE